MKAIWPGCLTCCYARVWKRRVDRKFSSTCEWKEKENKIWKQVSLNVLKMLKRTTSNEINRSFPPIVFVTHSFLLWDCLSLDYLVGPVSSTIIGLLYWWPLPPACWFDLIFQNKDQNSSLMIGSYKISRLFVGCFSSFLIGFNMQGYRDVFSPFVALSRTLSSNVRDRPVCRHPKLSKQQQPTI